MVEFQFPDGNTYQFPEGTTSEQAIDYYKKNIAIEESSKLGDVGRAIGQGVTFGFGDELAAGIQSALDDTTYEQALRQERGKLEKFRGESPYTAYGLEILSSIPSTLLGVGALGRAAQLGGKAIPAAAKLAPAAAKLAPTATQVAGKVASTVGAPTASLLGQTASSAALGGLYGAGAADDDKLKGAATGAALGGLLGGATGVVLPKATEQAKKLLEKGVPLTVGQATGGVLGAAERAASALPLVGDVIKKAQERATQGFNRAVIDSALEPIGINLPKGVAGQEAYDVARTAVSKAYDDIIPDLKIKDAESLRSSMQGAIRDAADDFGLWSGAGLEELNNAVKFAQASIPKTGKVDGQIIKRVESQLGNMAQRAFSRQDYGVMGAIREVQNKFRKELARQDKGGAAILQKVNTAQARLYPIEKAVNKAIASGGDFTPKQLLASMRAGAPKQTARGSAYGQDFAKAGQDVMGNISGGSGLTTTLVGAGALAKAASGDVRPAGLLAGLGAVANPFYSRAGVPLVRGAVTGSGGAIRAITPATSGLLGGDIIPPLANTVSGFLGN